MTETVGWKKVEEIIYVYGILHIFIKGINIVEVEEDKRIRDVSVLYKFN